jgi:hypothetical protein
MKTWSINGKLLLYAFHATPGAAVAGLCLVRATIKHFDGLDLAFTMLFSAALICDLLWTRREVRPLATNENTKAHATQFLWSCLFLSMISFTFGMAVSGYVWFNTDFLRTFGLIFWSAIMAIAIYPVCRDAKRLADATASSSW